MTIQNTAVSDFQERSNAAVKYMIDNGIMDALPITDHGVLVGQLFACSWGCEQTNVDFYEVVKVKGKKSIVVHKVASKKEYTGDQSAGCSMVGFCTPAPDDYIESEEFTVRVKGVKSEAFFKLEHGHAYFTEYDKKHRFSDYG